MSAEVLRRAASLMRERAESADERGEWWGVAPMARMLNQQDAEHIASWHPAVALAVADLLDTVASESDERAEKYTGAEWPIPAPILDVARAYLGESA